MKEVIKKKFQAQRRRCLCVFFLIDERYDLTKEIRSVLPSPREQKKLRVAAYCRVSTKSKAQKESLRNQISYYTERILDNDNWELAGVYYDLGKTGSRKKGRAGLERMLEQADKGKTDYVLTKSVGRVSRDTFELLSIVRSLREKGISMYLGSEKLDSLNPVAEAYITLSGAVVQEESRNISENMQWAVTGRLEQGISTNCKAFMGHQCIEGELVIVPEQAEAVKMISDFYLTGRTSAQIKTELEKRNIKTVTGKSQWDTTTIQKMLKNEEYKGDSLFQKTFIEDYPNGIHKKNEG